MSGDWRPASVGDCIETEFPGEWGSTPGNVSANASVLRSTNLDDNGHVDLAGGAPRVISTTKLASKTLLDGDLLLEGSGGGPGKPVGRVALFEDDGNGPYLCSNFFRTLRPSKLADSRFLLWRLLHLHRQPIIWTFQQQTTGIINLKHRDYFGHQLRLPPVPEQRRIAEILDTLDEAIRKTEQVIAKLQQMKQGLLHDLLTRGIDANGELRDPDRHPEQFKDSPLGRIPREWEVQVIGGLLKGVIDFRGRTPRKLGMNWGGGSIPALSAKNVRPGAIDLTLETYYGSDSLYERWMTKGDAEQGDVLLTMEAPLGNVAQIPDHRRYILSQRVVLLKFTASSALNDFMAVQMRSAPFQANLRRWSTGTTATGIQRAKLVCIPVVVPPPTEQRTIARTVEANSHRLHQEAAALRKFRTLKNGLMDDLLTGRVRTSPSGSR